MFRFLKWRKMTWVLAAWNGVAVAATLGLAFSSDSVAGCGVDSAGAPVAQLVRQDCIDAATRGFGLPVLALIWVVGLVALSAVWFETRPPWRQGHGARIRRLRSEDF